MAIEDKLREIRTQISTVQSKKARAQVEYDNALQRKNTARTQLGTSYGVTTTDQAKETLARLEAELETAIADVESALTEAGA